MKFVFLAILLTGCAAYAGDCQDAFDACISKENTCSQIPLNSSHATENRALCAEGLVLHCVEKVNRKFGADVCQKEAKQNADDNWDDDDDPDTDGDISPVSSHLFDI